MSAARQMEMASENVPRFISIKPAIIFSLPTQRPLPIRQDVARAARWESRSGGDAARRLRCSQVPPRPKSGLGENLRAKMPAAAFDAEWKAGHELTIEQSIELALS
jgi:hypothetical protein